VRDHTKLRAFELVDDVVVKIYQATKCFPKDEMYGLTSQMRRAAVSAPSNIVEGCARESKIEYCRYLEIAFGSLRELHYQFCLSKRLGYLNENDFIKYEPLIMEAEKVLGSLIRSVRKKDSS
jgi:four helix bundle protein